MGSGNMYLVGKHLVSWDCKMCKTVCVLVCNMELVCDMEFWNDQWIKQKTGKNWPSVNRQAWGKGWGGVEGVFICIESGKWAVILISCMSNKVIVRICCTLWLSILVIYHKPAFVRFVAKGFWWQVYMSGLDLVTTRISQSFSAYLLFISGWFPSCNAAWGCSSPCKWQMQLSYTKLLICFPFSCINHSLFFEPHYPVDISEKKTLWVIAKSSSDHFMGKSLSLGLRLSGCAQTRGRVWSPGLLGQESISALEMQITNKMYDSLSTWNESNCVR